MATVKFEYESSHNISFKGVVDSGIEREDWDVMSQKDRGEVMTQQLWELVDMYEADDTNGWALPGDQDAADAVDAVLKAKEKDLAQLVDAAEGTTNAHAEKLRD